MPGPTSIARSSCEPGCRRALERAIAYAEAAERLFSSGQKQEAYALSYLAMDECGKFILIAKELLSSANDPIIVRGFAKHNAKYGEVLDYCIRMVQSNTAKIMVEISKTPALDLSEAAKLAYKSIEDGSMLAEARLLNTDPLKYRNEAFYINFDGNWIEPRYPGDEVCAGQIKLVKGAAGTYLYYINTNGFLWLVSNMP